MTYASIALVLLAVLLGVFVGGLVVWLDRSSRPKETEDDPLDDAHGDYPHTPSPNPWEPEPDRCERCVNARLCAIHGCYRQECRRPSPARTGQWGCGGVGEAA